MAAYGKIDDWDVSRVTTMAVLFAPKTTCNPPIGNWNTAAVTSMYGMFAEASAFNQPIGNWNTAKVTDMGYMFYNAGAFNQLVCFPIPAGTDMNIMFKNTVIGRWGAGTPASCTAVSALNSFEIY